MKRKLIQIVLFIILAFYFTACEDKKEFKDTLTIEKEAKIKLPKPEWDVRLQNYDDTGVWFQEADNSEIAAYNIANAFHIKLKDYDNAIKWYLYSDYIKSYSSNLLNLAFVYGIKENYDKAIEYYKKSFILGNIGASNNLGILYQDKIKDFKNAEIWYKKAIERESIASLKGISDMYHFDLKDDVKASAYLINLISYPEYSHKKDKTINYLKNKWKLSDETIKKGYELQLTMPGLPKRYTGGI